MNSILVNKLELLRIVLTSVTVIGDQQQELEGPELQEPATVLEGESYFESRKN